MKSPDDILEAARRAFESYAAMWAPKDPQTISELQMALAAWQSRQFGAGSVEHFALGVSEEAGELCHAVLKHAQRIRGMGDRDAFVAKAADAVGDVCVYAIQLCTVLRIDFETVLRLTAESVMKRDWTKDPNMETE